MHIYIGQLTFHENLFYATREVGRLYETGRYLHNYALSYALGFVNAPYFNAQQTPRYAQDLLPLNQEGIYVTPARGKEIRYELNTFKYANNLYHVKMKPGQKNTPSYGRAKEIAVGSTFEFAVLSDKELKTLPQWIRMGLWLSKAHVTWHTPSVASLVSTALTSTLPLNPLDIEIEAYPQAFDLISMPPSSLFDNVAMKTDWWTAKSHDNTWRIPQNLQYRFPEKAF